LLGLWLLWLLSGQKVRKNCWESWGDAKFKDFSQIVGRGSSKKLPSRLKIKIFDVHKAREGWKKIKTICRKLFPPFVRGIRKDS